jgi:hypothetical protein
MGRDAAGRLPPPAARRLRPVALPDPARCGRFHPRHQPKEWQRLAEHYGDAVREQFLKRLASEIERRGALDVLRNGLKDSGVKSVSPIFGRRAASTPRRSGSMPTTSSPSSASFATARGTRRASTSCCF